MLQRQPGAEICAWAVTTWSRGITGWIIGRILTSSRPKLYCIRCFCLGNTLSLQEWMFTMTTVSWSLPWRMEAAGAPKLTVLLKTFFVPAGNTISALMFTMFRQVEIRLISLPEAGQMWIVCCQLAPGGKSNTFSSPTHSNSCPWIVTASVIEWVCAYLILRLVQLQNLAVSTIILGENQSKTSPNFMIIRITYPNLLHGSDFLCFLFMNY